MSGTVQGSLQPIANAEIHVYAADPEKLSAIQNEELAAPVRSDSRGGFQFPAAVACPSADSLIYIKAVGGVPAATGIANPTITLLNALGTCSSLTTQTTATVNEVTTVGAAWPLAAFATDGEQFLPAVGQAAQFSAAVESAGKLVSSDLGTTPGHLLASSEIAPVTSINSLANAIAACVVTNGGSAGDGSACGQLFFLAGYDSVKQPADTLAAALLIAKNPARNVNSLYSLASSKAVFLPSLSSAPADWALGTTSAATLPAGFSGPTSALPADNTQSAAGSDAATGSAASGSTRSIVPRLMAQDSPLVANTITIKTGGTYQGNWVSTDPAVAAVTINTDQPVIIQNSTITSRGNLISITGSTGANVTVQNVTGNAVDPLVAGKARGAFVVALTMSSLTVQNCTINGAQFGVKVVNSTATSLHINNNVATNLEDRASDGNGGFQTARPQLGHFIYLYAVNAPNGADIGWNQMVQTMGQSSIDTAIDIYNSKGASGYPILLHDNYLEGLSSPAVAKYSGNGIYLDGDSTAVNSFLNIQANEIVHTAGSGIAIISGHDNSATANRIVSCGKDLSGNWFSRTGLSATLMWNYYSAANFANNTISTTAGGMVVPNVSNAPVVSDVNAISLPATNSISNNNFTDPCLVGGALTLTAEDTERAYWANKFTTNGKVLGDQHGPVTVSVTPATTTLSLGQTQQYSASTTWASNTAVTWSVSPAIGSISSTGLYTAPTTPTASQTLTITATSVQDPTKSSNATIALSAPVNVSVTPAAATVLLSQSLPLTATVANATNTAVTWSISPAVGSISAGGVYTAPSTLASITAVTATATSVADSTKTASATLTIDPTPVAVSPATVALYASQTQQFTATAQGTANQNMVWSMSPSVGTLSTTGLYTAPASITSQQQVTITAYSTALAKYTTMKVTLYPPVKVSLYTSYFSISANQTSQLSALVQFTPNTAVTWSISPAVGTVSPTGLYTAPASITAQQNIAVTATSVADPTKSATGTVVLNPPVKVSLSPATVSLQPAATQQFTASVGYSSNTAVTWSMSPSVGTLSSSGLYTAPTSSATQQTVTVTATSVADTTKSASSVVTVAAGSSIGVSVTPTTAGVNPGQTQQYAATVTGTTNTNVTWSISPAIGSISATGRYTPPATPVTSPQTVTVTATSTADTSRTATSTLTVNPAVSLSVTPTSTALYASGTAQLTPTVLYNTNTAVTYTLSTAVGTISSTGLYTAPSSITAQQNVTVTITSAADPTKYVTSTITLYPPVKVSLYTSYFSDTVNQTSQFSALVQFTPNTAVTWSISPAVGTISSTGLYTAPASITAQQTVTVTATSVADATKTATGTVLLNPPVKVGLSPASVTLLPSAAQQFTASVAWASNTAVTWSLSPSLGTLSSSGLYSAPSNTTMQQTVTVTATSVADPTKSASSVVTLNPPVSISLSPTTAAVNPGQTQLYTATVLNTANTAVTWSINPAVGSISTSGRYTPPATPVTSPQTVTVTATSVVDPTKSATATVVANPAITVSVVPAAPSLYASQTSQLTPTVQWNANTAVTYSLSPAVGSISATGLYTAPSSITTQQQVSVTVMSVADPTKYAVANITLLPPVTVFLYTGHFTDTVNQTSQFSALVTNAANTSVTWSLSPAVGTIDATGLYTAPAVITAQQVVTVTATSVADPTKTATGMVMLNPPVNVVLGPGNAVLTASHSQQFTPGVSWTTNTAVTWSMSPSVGTLSSTGLYTAPATINATSTVAITATSVADPTKSATVNVTLLTLIGPAPIVITEGGTYSGNWISNDPNVPAVRVQTDAPVIIQNSTVQGAGTLISINGINGANVTVRNVTGTGLDPMVSGVQRGQFISAFTVQSLTVQNNTMSKLSFGVRVATSPALTSLSIMNNVASQLDDRASDGAGGVLTTRPLLGHFISLHNVVAPNGGEIGWNQLVQTIGQSSTEDAINIYNSAGASGFPLNVHDNYLEGYSSSTTGAYTGSGVIADGDSTGATAYVLFQANEMVHTAGSGVALASGHDNSAVANRVVSCGQDSVGNWYSRTNQTAAVIGNFYASANFNNNFITGTAGGMVTPDTNNLPIASDSLMRTDLGPLGNSAISGSLFTDPCLVAGVLNLSAEDTERAFWQTKLTANNITLGDQH